MPVRSGEFPLFKASWDRFPAAVTLLFVTTVVSNNSLFLAFRMDFLKKFNGNVVGEDGTVGYYPTKRIVLHFCW